MGRTLPVSRRPGLRDFVVIASLLGTTPCLAQVFCPCSPTPDRRPGPSSDECAAAVCVQVPGCCETAWDMLCAELANSLCGKCSSDCDGDGQPDACERDVRGNAGGGPNGVPDDCEPAADCNRNGVEDALDILTGRSADCDRDAIPDECRIVSNPDLDADGNGVLDACEGYPCEAMPGLDLVSWIAPPGSEQPWESEANWLGGRPGWNSLIVDGFGAAPRMDAALHCDQRTGNLSSSRTESLVALGAHTLEFSQGPGVGMPGQILLTGVASLQLDPRRTARGSRNGWLLTGSIESWNPSSTTLISSSPYTTIIASERVSLEGCEAMLRGETATPEFSTLSKSTLDTRGLLRPATPEKALRCVLHGNLRAWRTAFDADDSLRVVRTTPIAEQGRVERLEHTSTATSDASLLLIWDWASIPSSQKPLIDATKAGAPFVIKASMQLDATLAAGRVPRDGDVPSLRLVEQAADFPLQRYGLITGAPPRGRRYIQQEESVIGASGSPDTRALVLRLEQDDGTDPSLQTGLQAPLQGTEVGKVAVDLDSDGVDEVVVAVRRDVGAGQLRVYRIIGGTLQADLQRSIDLPEGQPIIPWNGSEGDGQPLDVGDFDGDGRRDLAVACDGAVPFRLYRNTGAGLQLHGEAAALPTGDRATCVAVIPARSNGGSFAPASGGFAGGSKHGSDGRVNSYPATGGSPISVQTVAGVPRTTRGGGTGGSQDSGIATGGSTKTRDFNFVDLPSGFVQWIAVGADGLLAPPRAPIVLADAPRDLAAFTVPNIGGSDRLCLAVANVTGGASDLTMLHGSGTDADGETGFSAIAPLATASGVQGACSVAAVPLFQKSLTSVPDLLVTRSDGRVIAVRTDADSRGSLSVGYAVTLASMPRESVRPAVGGSLGFSAGRARTTVIRTATVLAFAGTEDQIVLEPLAELTSRSLPADIDGNGRVDFGDLTMLLLDMGPCANCATDLDHNGVVDFGDATLVLLSFGETS